jgi:hypothetical protein
VYDKQWGEVQEEEEKLSFVNERANSILRDRRSKSQFIIKDWQISNLSLPEDEDRSDFDYFSESSLNELEEVKNKIDRIQNGEALTVESSDDSFFN